MFGTIFVVASDYTTIIGSVVGIHLVFGGDDPSPSPPPVKFVRAIKPLRAGQRGVAVV